MTRYLLEGPSPKRMGNSIGCRGFAGLVLMGGHAPRRKRWDCEGAAACTRGPRLYLLHFLYNIIFYPSLILNPKFTIAFPLENIYCKGLPLNPKSLIPKLKCSENSSVGTGKPHQKCSHQTYTVPGLLFSSIVYQHMQGLYAAKNQHCDRVPFMHYGKPGRWEGDG